MTSVWWVSFHSWLYKNASQHPIPLALTYMSNFNNFEGILYQKWLYTNRFGHWNILFQRKRYIRTFYNFVWLAVGDNLGESLDNTHWSQVSQASISTTLAVFLNFRFPWATPRFVQKHNHVEVLCSWVMDSFVVSALANPSQEPELSFCGCFSHDAEFAANRKLTFKFC